ncbi:sulfatase [Candidatus Altiarchaeota archaeon]
MMRRKGYIVISVLVLFSLIYGCLERTPENEGGISRIKPDIQSAGKQGNDFNIIFILVDTLRADHMGAYGYPRNTSPNIDDFASNNILFEEVRSQASCTFPSVNSILTSRYSFNFHGQNDTGFPDNVLTIAEILKKNDYSTSAITSSPIVRDTPVKLKGGYYKGGYGNGFEEFVEDITWKSAKIVNIRAKKLLDKFENSSKPFFLYLHYTEPHGPYKPPKTFTKKFATYPSPPVFKQRYLVGDRPVSPTAVIKGLKANPGWELSGEGLEYMVDNYDDEIAFFDQEFKGLMDELSRRGLMENTMIIVASDHGEGFMEHDFLKHCVHVYDEEAKVPLIMRIPGTGHQRIDGVVQNIDIMPTILDYVGIDCGCALDGRSLRSSIESGNPSENYAYTEQDEFKSVYDGRHKLIKDISTGEYFLYDIENDPKEKHNIFSRNPIVKGKLEFSY